MRTAIVTVAVVLPLTLAACGGDDDGAVPRAGSGDEPTIVEPPDDTTDDAHDDAAGETPDDATGEPGADESGEGTGDEPIVVTAAADTFVLDGEVYPIDDVLDCEFYEAWDQERFVRAVSGEDTLDVITGTDVGEPFWFFAWNPTGGRDADGFFTVLNGRWTPGVTEERRDGPPAEIRADRLVGAASIARPLGDGTFDEVVVEFDLAMPSGDRVACEPG